VISNWGLFALAIIVFINMIFIASLAVLLFIINKKLDEGLNKAAPLLERATETLGKVEQTTALLQERVEQVLDKTTELVDHVSERVDTTTAIAEEAITEPLIGAASLMAAVNRGLRTYSERTSTKGDGTNGG